MARLITVYTTGIVISSYPLNSNDKSPPSKFILICLLLSSGVVFKISIETSLYVIIKTLDTLILPHVRSLFYSLDR